MIVDGLKMRSRVELNFSFFFSSRRRHTRWNCDWSSDVCSSITISIFENFNPVARFLSLRRTQRIFIEFKDPKPTAFIPGHRHGIDHVRFRSEEADFKSGRHGELLLRFGSRQWSRARGRILAGELPACRQQVVGSDEQGEQTETANSHALPQSKKMKGKRKLWLAKFASSQAARTARSELYRFAKTGRLQRRSIDGYQSNY